MLAGKESTGKQAQFPQMRMGTLSWMSGHTRSTQA